PIPVFHLKQCKQVQVWVLTLLLSKASNIKFIQLYQIAISNSAILSDHKIGESWCVVVKKKSDSPEEFNIISAPTSMSLEEFLLFLFYCIVITFYVSII